MQPLTSYFPILLVGLTVSFLAAPAAVRIARRFGLVDVPGSRQHKRHTHATPLAGGMAIAASLLVNSLWRGWAQDPMLLAMMAGAAVILCLGLLDDRLNLMVAPKLLGQCAAAIILIAAGVQVRLLGDAFGVVLTFLWVVGVTNAFNFVDSMDGLALGLAGVASAFFMLATIDAGQPSLASLAAGMMGATVGLYFFNLTPARLFLGDSGSQVIGFLLAAIGVAYVPRDFAQAASWYVPILVLGVPLFDVALVMSSRLRGGRRIYQAGSDHTYHRLLLLGLEAPRAVFAMQLTAVVLGLLAFIGLQAGPYLGNVLVAALALVAVGLILFLEKYAPPEA